MGLRIFRAGATCAIGRPLIRLLRDAQVDEIEQRRFESALEKIAVDAGERLDARRRNSLIVDSNTHDRTSS